MPPNANFNMPGGGFGPGESGDIYDIDRLYDQTVQRARKTQRSGPNPHSTFGYAQQGLSQINHNAPHGRTWNNFDNPTSSTPPNFYYYGRNGQTRAFSSASAGYSYVNGIHNGTIDPHAASYAPSQTGGFPIFPVEPVGYVPTLPQQTAKKQYAAKQSFTSYVAPEAQVKAAADNLYTNPALQVQAKAKMDARPPEPERPMPDLEAPLAAALKTLSERRRDWSFERPAGTNEILATKDDHTVHIQLEARRSGIVMRWYSDVLRGWTGEWYAAQDAAVIVNHMLSSINRLEAPAKEKAAKEKQQKELERAIEAARVQITETLPKQFACTVEREGDMFRVTRLDIPGAPTHAYTVTGTPGAYQVRWIHGTQGMSPETSAGAVVQRIAVTEGLITRPVFEGRQKQRESLLKTRTDTLQAALTRLRAEYVTTGVTFEPDPLVGPSVSVTLPGNVRRIVSMAAGTEGVRTYLQLAESDWRGPYTYVENGIASPASLAAFATALGNRLGLISNAEQARRDQLVQQGNAIIANLRETHALPREATAVVTFNVQQNAARIVINGLPNQNGNGTRSRTLALYRTGTDSRIYRVEMDGQGYTRGEYVPGADGLLPPDQLAALVREIGTALNIATQESIKKTETERKMRLAQVNRIVSHFRANHVMTGITIFPVIESNAANAQGGTFRLEIRQPAFQHSGIRSLEFT